MIQTIYGITFIGTAHISNHSAELVAKTIRDLRPEVVAVELDSMRLQKLLQEQEEEKNYKHLSEKEKKTFSKKKQKTNNSKLVRQVGLFGFVFLKIAGYAQKKMGKAFHIEPGIDMLGAVTTSRELDISLCLADRPILHTIAEFKKLSIRQKLSMVKRMIFTKMSYSEKKNLAEKIQNDKLDEKTIMTIISTLKENVPELYDILIHKRNQYMVNKLIQLKKKGFENIVIVIGAGHMPGMIELLKQRYRDEEELKNSNATQMNFVVES